MIHAYLMGGNYISDFMLLKILLGAFSLDNGIWSRSSVSAGAGADFSKLFTFPQFTVELFKWSGLRCGAVYSNILNFMLFFTKHS